MRKIKKGCVVLFREEAAQSFSVRLRQLTQVSFWVSCLLCPGCDILVRAARKSI